MRLSLVDAGELVGKITHDLAHRLASEVRPAYCPDCVYHRLHAVTPLEW